MKFKISIGLPKMKETNGLELIPNPEGIQPVEWCQTCGREYADLFWDRKQTICTDCDKSRYVHKKLGIPMLDEGLSLVDFFAVLRSRVAAWEQASN